MRAFLDTNIIIYAFSQDDRAERARSLLGPGSVVGVQSLNEFVNVARRKLRMSWEELDRSLAMIRELCELGAPIDLGLHELGLTIARRYQIAIFDALVVAAALIAECDTLWSEDLHEGLVIDRRLTIRNPFKDFPATA